MAWHVGIDEAGYGPNLGPLVMTAVACRVPTKAIEADLWELLGHGVRRHGGPDDGRLVVADSKLVYSAARGIGPLEKAVLAAVLISDLFPHGAPLFLDLGSLIALLAPDALADLESEVWYRGTGALPIRCDPATLAAARDRLIEACRRAGVTISLCRSVIVCPCRFNDVTDAANTKAAVLSLGLTRLIRDCIFATEARRSAFVIDKHGGRNQYAATLEDAFPGGTVRVREEGEQRSTYDVDGLDRKVRVTIVPRADAEHFSVALASMVSKYLREALMGEFNAFWQTHVPGLKPTAGYPLDASRFFGEIRPIVASLGLSDRQVWRQR
jgi:ribonuclease HII